MGRCPSAAMPGCRRTPPECSPYRTTPADNTAAPDPEPSRPECRQGPRRSNPTPSQATASPQDPQVNLGTACSRPLRPLRPRRLLGDGGEVDGVACRSRLCALDPDRPLLLPRRLGAAAGDYEAEVVLAVPDTSTPIGLRDRSVMELLYATAMRRGEVVGLDLPDVDLARGWLTLRNTKTCSDRVVPMGERAAAWLVRYLAGARPELLVGEDPGQCCSPPTGSASGPPGSPGRSTATSRDQES